MKSTQFTSFVSALASALAAVLAAQAQVQRSEQTATFLRDLRKFLLSSLDVVAERKMKSVQRNRLHAVEVFAEVPGSVVDFPIRKSP